MNLQDVIEHRRSVKQFEPNVPISDDQLRQLFESVTLTPSSFNIQHWDFVVIREQANKDALMERASGQAHVGQCSAAIIVVADPKRYELASGLWRRSGVPEDVAKRMETLIPAFYEGKEQFARDEAIRSCGMAAMTLMLRAQDMGLGTCPMIGFDADAVAEHFSIKLPRFPAMLIALGTPAKQASGRPRPFRRPVSEIVKLESATGRSL